MGMEQAWLIPAIPAAAFVVLLLFGRYLPRRGDWVAIGAATASFVLFFPVLIDLLDKLDPSTGLRTGGPDFPGRHGWDWVSFGEFELRLGFQVDQLTVVMLAVVSFVGLMVQVYSTGYMRGDARYGWYF